MLSNVKFVSREQLEQRHHHDRSNKDNIGERRRRRSRRKKNGVSQDDSHTSSDEKGKVTVRCGKEKSKSRKKDPRCTDSEEDDSVGRSGSDNPNDDSEEEVVLRDVERNRREMGLDWMLDSARKQELGATPAKEPPQGSKEPEDVMIADPKELNPYLKDNRGGYPNPDEASLRQNNLFPSSLVGDGGASWRLKALKRAKEQASREGKRLNEVVEERWGSLAQLAVPVGSQRAAPARAHLHAIRDRKRGPADSSVHVSPDDKGEDVQKVSDDRIHGLEYRSSCQSEMRKPKSYSWKKESNGQSTENKLLIAEAISSSNRFRNDGSFMEMFGKNKGVVASSTPVCVGSHDEENLPPTEICASEREPFVDNTLLDPNQLAAEAFRLRMKGKHEEADMLLKKVESMKQKQDSNIKIANPVVRGRYLDVKSSGKRREEDADLYLAHKIARNKQFSIAKQAGDEYDFDDDGSRRKGKKKQANVSEEKNRMPNRLLTQEQRCQFCFENSTRAKHLVVAIAQFSYMALPPWQPVVQGHCCILTMQHESSTRSVDDNVWEELRNFKKCLIMMFDKQDKDVVFLETVIDLAKQQRHCLVECIPLPRDIAKEAPLYFKKAIDEAEDEWSQHNAKKLIRTSREKGLRRSIPKDFPYFHVEFGLDEGFVHVIDDELNFKSSLGLNVIRGMLGLPEEDMYRRRRYEHADRQRHAVADFAREWEPFDWTKQLS